MQDSENNSRREVYALGIAVLIIAAAAILALNYAQKASITGSLVADTESGGGITQEQAFNALLQAEKDMKEMQDAGLSVSWINDTLLEARKAFQGENYTALLIEAESINYTDRREFAKKLLTEAQKAIENGQKVEVSYERILEKTKAISERKEKGFLLKDSLTALELEIGELKQAGLNASKAEDALAGAKIELDDERYEQAEELLGGIGPMLAEIRAEETIIRTIYKAGRETTSNFLKENLSKIITTLAIAVIIILLFANQIKIKLLQKKLKDMRLEQEVMTELLKKAQNDYYSKKSISKQIFDVKVESYKTRMLQLKRELPVVEERLRKLHKGKRLV